MQEPQAAYYEDAAPLDPLYMESAPAAGPNFTVAGLLLAAAASLALLARKALNQEPVSNGLYPADMSMATVMAAPAKKSKFSRRREALEPVVEGKKLYPVAEALQLVKETSTAKFTESVDVAVLLGVDPRKSDQMVRGSVVLPGGTGKLVRVAAFCQDEAADAAKEAGAEFVGLEDLSELIKGGEMGFDVVVATPDCMRVALQLGKILGPRGLMPNPKDGTVNLDIAAAVKNAKAGQVKYRTDKGGVVHCPIGKSDFSVETLAENLNALISDLNKAKPASCKGIYMKKIVVSSTMGKGVYVDPSSLK
jgi:large subunit ribosomal protein L1